MLEGRADKASWRRSLSSLPRGKGVRTPQDFTTLQGWDREHLEMRGPAGEGGKGYGAEGLHWKAWSSSLRENPREPLTTDTPYQLSPRAGQARRQALAPGSVLVTHCHMTSYSKTWRPETTDTHYCTASVTQECRWGSAACLWLKLAIGLRLKGKRKVAGRVCLQAHSSSLSM